MERANMPWMRAILISLPFFALSLFWQAYDYTVPLMLSQHFHLKTTAYSIIMSADNIIALIFLPVFGILSDRIHCRLGRRTPVILLGTLGGIIGWLFLTKIDALAAAGHEVFLPYLAALLVSVFFMSLHRSPSAALAADCFIRPQRTKANAVLNLTGALAGVLFGLAGRRLIHHPGAALLFTDCMYFVLVIIAAATVAFFLTVREATLVAKVQQQNLYYGLIDEKTDTTDSSPTKLSATEKKSFWLILTAVFLVYMSYNGFHTHYTNYLVTYLQQPASWTGPYLLEVSAGMLMMIPAAFLTSHLGRRKCCIIGTLLCSIGYLGTSLVTPENVNMIYLWFLIAAVGFPLFGINLGPMILEIGKDSDAGRFMGYYYIATISAQIVTPTLASIFINHFGYGVIGFYGAVFTLIACVMFFPVRHGDVRPSFLHAIDDSVSDPG